MVDTFQSQPYLGCKQMVQGLPSISSLELRVVAGSGNPVGPLANPVHVWSLSLLEHCQTLPHPILHSCWASLLPLSFRGLPHSEMPGYSPHSSQKDLLKMGVSSQTPFALHCTQKILQGPTQCISFPTFILPLAATLASLPVLEHSKLSPTAGPCSRCSLLQDELCPPRIHILKS